MGKLTDRWTDLRAHTEQRRYWRSPHRFNVVPAGRRSGKTELAKRKVVRRAFLGSEFANPRFFAGAPTRDQAKRIFWDDLKALVPKRFMKVQPSETELNIRLVNGASIWVLGMDKPERVEGQPWDGGVLDEFGNMKPQTWTAHVRPALSDRRGWCDFVGVPEGRNHYYELDLAAAADTSGDWGRYHWVSADILPASEIEAARRDLDDLTFQQEYEASFVNFQGRAYYPFDEKLHCARLDYDPHAELIFCFDFNVEPGVCAIVQEQDLPNGNRGTAVIGEVWIPRNSNTPLVCNRLKTDWSGHQGPVTCYGDATGGARGSAKVQGSDWDLIKQALRFAFPQIRFAVPRANPPERSRINAVNSRLMSAAGDVRLMVDPSKAKHVVIDLEGVRVIEGGSGEIDKNSDASLTHISDALGYYIVKQFPVLPQRAAQIATPGLY